MKSPFTHSLKKTITGIILFLFVQLCYSPYLNAQGAGNALKFNGGDDVIIVGSNGTDELNPSQVTVETWVYLTEATSGTHRPHLIGKANSYQLMIETNENPIFWISDGVDWVTATGITDIKPNQWYHIAGTYDGSSHLSIYVNGVLEDTTNHTAPMVPANKNVRLGGRTDGATEEFLVGYMDEARIWNVARSESEIQQTAFQKLKGTEENLIGYWRLNETSGTTAADLTSYANDGTLTNMVGTEWMISSASIGDTSIFSKSVNITETDGCSIDVTFGIDADAPDKDTAVAVIQVNETPNFTDGIYGSAADTYWELFSEDVDFDGEFTATVNFHYDSLGISDETQLTLYRRDTADAITSWTEVAGATIVSNDGAASTETDGVGFAQITIDEATAGGFSGQYILGWNNVPVTTVPGETIDEGGTFATITLDNYVADSEDADAGIAWSYSGNTSLTVSIVDRVATISTPALNPDWFGNDTITFTATDTKGGKGSNDAVFIVNSVNDLPVVSDIVDQIILEDADFDTITLDDFVMDVEDADDAITWSYTDDGENALTITIDANRKAAIVAPANWFGSETITFTAKDQDGGTDSDDVTFTATSVNDLPVVSDIGDQTILEDATFDTIILDNFVTDIEDVDDSITWTYTQDGESALTITINDNRVASIVAPANWYGSDTITFTATDKDGGADSNKVAFTATSINDAPVVDDIPSESITEGGSFTQINLNNYVEDVEDVDADIAWTYTGNAELTISIDASNIATITAPADWYGSETITFIATDLGDSTDTDDAIFTVSAINDAPVVDDIPGETIEEDGTFTTIDLNTYVADVEDADADITWTYTGNTNLTVAIDANKIATITAPANWYGSETITFIATDLGDSTDTDDAIFEVTSVNDLPIVTDIPGETIEEDGTFATISLNDFVEDVEDADADIEWTYTGDDELTVSIDASNIVTITAPANWYGSDTIVFTATDLNSGAASDTAIFVSTSVNDDPVVGDIPGETINKGETFATINLDDFVTDVEDADANLDWNVSGNANLTIDINANNIVTITAPADWTGKDTVTFTVTDLNGGTASDTAIFAVVDLVGIESISSIISMDVYPNPGKGVFKVSTQLSKNQNITLNIFSLTGELILSEQYNNGQFGENVYELDLSHVTKGLYLVEVISEDNSRLLKRLVIK